MVASHISSVPMLLASFTKQTVLLVAWIFTQKPGGCVVTQQQMKVLNKHSRRVSVFEEVITGLARLHVHSDSVFSVHSEVPATGRL